MAEEMINNVEEMEEGADSPIIKLFRFLLRIIVVIIFGIILGVGAYLGIPAIYREFVQPVQTNTRELETLMREFERMQDDLSSQTMRVDELTGLIEGSLAEQRESISELAAQVGTLGTSVLELEESAKSIAGLEGRLDTVDGSLERLGSQVEGLETKLEETDTPAAKLARQLQLIKAMELTTRARFWFIQNNLGNAREDIQSAKEVVQGVLSGGQDDQIEVLTSIIDRLDQALLTVELTPVVAADDLEIVWQLLILATEP